MRDLPFEIGAVTLVADDIERNPELFLLLQKEARQMGLRVPDAQVDRSHAAHAPAVAHVRPPAAVQPRGDCARR